MLWLMWTYESTTMVIMFKSCTMYMKIYKCIEESNLDIDEYSQVLKKKENMMWTAKFLILQWPPSWILTINDISIFKIRLLMNLPFQMIIIWDISCRLSLNLVRYHHICLFGWKFKFRSSCKKYVILDIKSFL